MNNLPNIFGDLQRQYQVSAGDFPNVERMQVNTLPQISSVMLRSVAEVIRAQLSLL